VVVAVTVGLQNKDMQVKIDILVV